MSKKGDLWHLLYDTRLEFRPVSEEVIILHFKVLKVQNQMDA